MEKFFLFLPQRVFEIFITCLAIYTAFSSLNFFFFFFEFCLCHSSGTVFTKLQLDGRGPLQPYVLVVDLF